jgi:hypothetical protein
MQQPGNGTPDTKLRRPLAERIALLRRMAEKFEAEGNSLGRERTLARILELMEEADG